MIKVNVEQLEKKHINFILQSSFELSNQAIYWINQAGRIIYANEVGCNDLGYSKEEITRLNVWDVNPEVNSQKKFSEIFKSFSENENESERGNVFESTHKTKEGMIFPVEVSSKFVIMDESPFLISYVRDISNRIERTERLQLYFEFLNITSDIIFLVNKETQYVEFANKVACEKLGFTVEEFRTKRVSDFRKALNSNSMEIPEIFRQIGQEESMTTYGLYGCKDGNSFPVETTLSMKSYQSTDYIIAISRDITERVEIEKKKESLNQKLKNYNKTLEDEVNNAKEELHEYERLMYHQSKMAAMGEMLENIAHQWRQPLSVVSVLATGMKLQNESGLLNKELLEAGLDDINKNSQFLSKTIDDFSEFFKPNKNKTSFVVEHAIDNALTFSASASKDLEIEVIKNCANLELFTFQNEFIQVLVNLLNNARDALKLIDSKRYIFIEVYSTSSEIIIEVKDNAGGINDEIKDKVFEPYFTTKHKSQGTGIGLYMSQEIVKKHMKGKLIVSNEAYEYKTKRFTGAKFSIVLLKNEAQ